MYQHTMYIHEDIPIYSAEFTMTHTYTLPHPLTDVHAESPTSTSPGSSLSLTLG